MKKITLNKNDFEKELEKLSFDLQERIKTFKDVKPKPNTRKDIELYLKALDIAKIRKQISDDVSDTTIYTYLGIEKRSFARLRDDGLKKLNNIKKQEETQETQTKNTKEETNLSNNLDFKKVKQTNDTNQFNEAMLDKLEIIKKLEEIKQQNEKIISFYELSKKKKEENNFSDSQKQETQETDDDDLYFAEDYRQQQLRSFRVNPWILGEFLRIAKEKGIKVGVATNKAFKMFIQKYS